jgi:hypothetical protein
MSIQLKVLESTTNVGNVLRQEIQADIKTLETELVGHLQTIQRANTDSVASAATVTERALGDLKSTVGTFYHEKMNTLKDEVSQYSQNQLVEFERKAVVERDRNLQKLTLVENQAKQAMDQQGATLTADLRIYVEGVKSEDQVWKQRSDNTLSEIKTSLEIMKNRQEMRERALDNVHERLQENGKFGVPAQQRRAQGKSENAPSGYSDRTDLS